MRSSQNFKKDTGFRYHCLWNIAGVRSRSNAAESQGLNRSVIKWISPRWDQLGWVNVTGPRLSVAI